MTQAIQQLLGDTLLRDNGAVCHEVGCLTRSSANHNVGYSWLLHCSVVTDRLFVLQDSLLLQSLGNVVIPRQSSVSLWRCNDALFSTWSSSRQRLARARRTLQCTSCTAQTPLLRFTVYSIIVSLPFDMDLCRAFCCAFAINFQFVVHLSYVKTK